MMKIGFIGLGKMGSNMVQRLLLDGHEMVVWDPNPEAVKFVASKGAIAVSDLEEMIMNLPERKIIWLMVPSGSPVDANIEKLTGMLGPGSILIDGGNSNWKDTIKRMESLKNNHIDYVDCGTSGGVWGLQNGYCLMYGGDREACTTLTPVFESLAEPGGHLYCGNSGSGHFTKMIHNGIEYGMMQAYAEGFEILEKSGFGTDLSKVADLWMHGSVVRSWLLELIGNALQEDPGLEKIKPYVSDSGEARWTVDAAVELSVPAHVITASLFTRFFSRQDDSLAMKLVAAMRNQFGGHEVKQK
jgi:6-phosphogluconate dehydrogenase